MDALLNALNALYFRNERAEQLWLGALQLHGH